MYQIQTEQHRNTEPEKSSSSIETATRSLSIAGYVLCTRMWIENESRRISIGTVWKNMYGLNYTQMILLYLCTGASLVCQCATKCYAIVRFISSPLLLTRAFFLWLIMCYTVSHMVCVYVCMCMCVCECNSDACISVCEQFEHKLRTLHWLPACRACVNIHLRWKKNIYGIYEHM